MQTMTADRVCLEIGFSFRARDLSERAFKCVQVFIYLDY